MSPKTIKVELVVPDCVSTKEALEIMHNNFCGFKPYVDSQVVVSSGEDNNSAVLTVFTDELKGTDITEGISKTSNAVSQVLDYIHKTIENEDLKGE